MSETNNLKEYLDFTVNTLRKAGEVLLSYRDTFQVKKTKDPLSLDIATSADYAAEKLIVDEIKHIFPNHSIMTEETQGLDTRSDFEWIIDPLDGTKEYVRHSPYFYTLLALERKGELIIGAGYQPEVRRMFAAAKDIGLQVNGHKASLSLQNELARSMISIGLPVNRMNHRLLKPYFRLLEDLTFKCYRLRNTPWDVEALFHVSMGLTEGYILPPHEPGRGPKWWDIASGIAALTANGGKITDFYGEPLQKRSNEKGIVASNGRIHEELLTCIRDSYK